MNISRKFIRTHQYSRNVAIRFVVGVVTSTAGVVVTLFLSPPAALFGLAPSVWFA